MAWRCWDCGYRVWYGANLQAHHPAAAPTRHAMFYRMHARNRVWVARRTLPLPLVPLYVGIWSTADLIKLRADPAARQAWSVGWKEGWCQDPGPRHPIRWVTVALMAGRGRPPII
ncbi:MAG: hypothetical protein WCI74_02970 [Actinomycetes bacterium]